MNVMVELNREEIHEKLAYGMICQTRYGSSWETMKRKRRWMAEFTEAEREAAERIFRKSHAMFLISGVPDSMVMSVKTLALWEKIADFCASL